MELPNALLSPLVVHPGQRHWAGRDHRPGWSREAKDVSTLMSPGFRAPPVWGIEWSFDCSNFKRYNGGNFKITGNGAFGQIQIQEFDIRASGTRTFNRSGYGRLLVDSVCKRWSVKALPGSG